MFEKLFISLWAATEISEQHFLRNTRPEPVIAAK